MSERNSNVSTNKNYTYIAIFSLAIIAVIIIAFVTKCSNNPSNSTTNSSVVTTALSVISESGDKSNTIKAAFKLRNCNFSNSMNKIKKFEAKQKDSKDDPSVSSSNDGYTYMTYSFDSANLTEFFGIKPASNDSTSLLQYVFHNNKMLELRIQYGNIGKASFDSVIANITSQYGTPTYSRSYSNGSTESWWKTKSATLDIIYQNTNVMLSYKNNK